jgi:hypothetical protein
MKFSFFKKFLYSFGLLFAIVTGLKLGVDTCVPNPESQIISVSARPEAICRPLRSWDDSARYRNALTRNSSSLFFPFERDSVDRLSVLDVAIFWKAPADLTILLSRVPDNHIANQKICLFLFSCSLCITFLWHYLARVIATLTAFPVHTARAPERFKNDELILSSGKRAVLDWGKKEEDS